MSGDDHCPTCGAPVRVISRDDGTQHYEPVAQPLATPRSELRRQAFTTGACPICFRDTTVTEDDWTIRWREVAELLNDALGAAMAARGLLRSPGWPRGAALLPLLNLANEAADKRDALAASAEVKS